MFFVDRYPCAFPDRMLCLRSKPSLLLGENSVKEDNSSSRSSSSAQSVSNSKCNVNSKKERKKSKKIMSLKTGWTKKNLRDVCEER